MCLHILHQYWIAGLPPQGGISLKNQRSVTRPASLVVAFLVVVGLLVASIPGVGAQPTPMTGVPDHRGTEFWLTFPETSTPDYFSVAITGDPDTAGEVTVEGLGFSAPFTVPAGGVVYVRVPTTARVLTDDGIEKRGVRVTADAGISVHGLLFDGGGSFSSYLALPANMLGSSYMVLGYEVTTASTDRARIAVIATANATTVTVTPAITVGDKTAGVPYSVALDAGEVYQLGTAVTAADLTGTTVTSDKPVAVVSSSRCARIPVNTNFCDLIMEQLLPVDTWGTAFVTVPTLGRLNGDRIRVLAASDDTEVTINGTEVQLQRGEFHEQIVDEPAYITSDRPVLLAQYGHSAKYDGPAGIGDPFMMLVPPVQQYLTAYTVATPEISVMIDHFIRIVVPVGAEESVTLDGVPLAATFVPIGSSGYAATQIEIDPGAYVVAADEPISVVQYGWAGVGGYGFPAGMALAPIAAVAGLTVTPATAALEPGTEQCFTATALDADGQPLAGLSVGFDVTGTHTTSGSGITDADGQVEFCYTGTDRGDDMVVATQGAFADAASVAWRWFEGLVAGSGVIMSPRGAVAQAPSATNRAVFSFAVSHAEETNTPVGQVTFTYSHGTFQATALDLLTVEDSEITIAGSGTLNGSGSYEFLLTAVDGSPDAFRIQIWSGATVVYDNGSVQPLLGGLVMIRE